MRIAYAAQLVSLAFAIGFAIYRGGWPERAAAASMTAMYALDAGFHAIWGYHASYLSTYLGHFVIDAVIWVILLAIAFRASRWWTLWLASAQTIALGSHLLRSSTEVMAPWVYAAMTRAPSWFQIVLLVIGTELYRRRAKTSAKFSQRC